MNRPPASRVEGTGRESSLLLPSAYLYDPHENFIIIPFIHYLTQIILQLILSDTRDKK